MKLLILFIASLLPAALFAQSSTVVGPTNLGSIGSISALRAIAPNSFANGTFVQVAGYSAANDGGGGVYIWNATSTASDNSWSVIEPTSGGTGRWLLMVSNYVGPRIIADDAGGVAAATAGEGGGGESVLAGAGGTYSQGYWLFNWLYNGGDTYARPGGAGNITGAIQADPGLGLNPGDILFESAAAGSAGASITWVPDFQLLGPAAGGGAYLISGPFSLTQSTATIALGTYANAYTGLWVDSSLSGGTSQIGLIDEPTFGSGATTAGYDEVIQIITSPSMTMPLAVGLHIENPFLAASTSITNNEAILIDDQTAGSSTNYAIKTGKGLVHFGDTTSIGTNALGADSLQITGNVGYNYIDLFENATAKWSLFPRVTGYLDFYSAVLGSNALELDTSGDGTFEANVFVGTTLHVASGSNAKAGSATLSSGTVTVSNTSVTSHSVIHVCLQPGGGSVTAAPYVSSATSGTGFTIKAGASDSATVNWWIEENN